MRNKILYKIVLIVLSLIIMICFVACDKIEVTVKTNDKEQDNNIYLFEEACFAGEVYFTVTNMEIQENPDFAIILTINVEQRNEDRYENNIDITSDMFTIKSTNNAMSLAIGTFYSAILKAGIEAGIGAIFGETPSAVDVIGTIVEEYADNIVDIVEEAQSSFSIKASGDQFEPFKSKNIEGSTNIKVRFDFTEEQLKTEKLIMLVIDDGSKNTGHLKRKIYLITRPEGNNI